MDRQQFKEDTAGTLAFYPPEQAVASAGTVALYAPGGSVLQAAAAVTIDSASTTLASAATDGARSVVLTSATGTAAGIKYLLQEAGKTHVVEVRSMSGTTAYLVGELTADFTTAATWKGYRQTYALTATHTADRADNYRADWAYTIASVAHTATTSFDVVSAPDWWPTTIADVVGRYDRVGLLLDSRDLDGYELLRTSWQHMLKPALAARGMRIERIRDYDHLVPLHCACVNELLAENAAMIDPNALVMFELAKARRHEIQASITSDVPWYDSDDNLAADGGETRTTRASIVISR